MSSGGKRCPQFEGIVESGSQWMGRYDHRFLQEEELFCCPQSVYITNSSVKTAQAKHSCATFNPAKLGSKSREEIGYCRHREKHRSPETAESILPV